MEDKKIKKRGRGRPKSTTPKPPKPPSKPHGGPRVGSGRKSKVEEQELVEKLKQFDTLAMKILKEKLTEGNFKFWQTFMSYRYGRPKEKLDITSGGEAFNIPIIEFFKTDKD